jgi:hypothetical protein
MRRAKQVEFRCPVSGSISTLELTLGKGQGREFSREQLGAGAMPQWAGQANSSRQRQREVGALMRLVGQRWDKARVNSQPTLAQRPPVPVCRGDLILGFGGDEAAKPETCSTTALLAESGTRRGSRVAKSACHHGLRPCLVPISRVIYKSPDL